MFRQLLTLTIAAMVVTLASPVFAGSTSFQLTVTIPPHAMPVQAIAPGIEKTAAQIEALKTIQEQQIVRNDQKITVQSIVVL